jgi:hypothetical protein
MPKLGGGNSMAFCSNCGNQVVGVMQHCPYCGSNLNTAPAFSALEPTWPLKSTAAIPQTEITYYSDDKGVTVTTTRIIIGNATYSMANISSIKTARKIDNIIAGIISGIFGIIFILGSVTQNQNGVLFRILGSQTASFLALMIGLIGVLLLILAIILFFMPTWRLKITSASQETAPLESRDEEYIDQVARAINEALIQRG